MPTPSAATPLEPAARGPLGRALDRALLDLEDPTALGLTRILVVAVMTASLLAHLGAVGEYFSDASPVFGEYARRAFPTRVSIFFWIRDPWAVRAVFGLGVVAHLCWLVGLFTAPAALVSAALWLSMVGRNPLLYALPDQLHGALVFLLALMPTGRGLSLDARWRGKGGPVPVWCRRLIQLQMAVVYTYTGVLKSGPAWHEKGTAIYYALVNPYNRHFDLAPILAWLQPWLLRPITWLVLVWEVAFAGFALENWLREALGRRRWLPDLRWMFLGFGAAMHLGIQLMLYVVSFSMMCVAAYASYLSPEEARRIVARARGWLGRPPPPAAT